MRKRLVLALAAAVVLVGFALAHGPGPRGPAEHVPREPAEEMTLRTLERHLVRAEGVLMRRAEQQQKRIAECDAPGAMQAQMRQQQRGPQTRWQE